MSFGEMKNGMTLCLVGVCMVCAQVSGAEIGIPEDYTRSVDSLALYIGSRCPTDEDRLEMLYRWMTAQMSYNPYPFLEREDESDEEVASRTLRSRSGVCRHFARLFSTVGKRMQIPVYVVEGYVRSRTGRLATSLHAWCVARLGREWRVYDPTWDMGSGSAACCGMQPEAAIRTHMPCDPVWQLLEHPVSYEAFDSGRTDPTQGAGISFNDSIRAYLRQTPAEQLAGVNRRMRANGRPNSLTDYYMQVNEKNLEVYRNREVSRVFRAALRLNNRAIDILGDLDCYRRNDCLPKRSEEEVERLMDEARSRNHEADRTLAAIETRNTSLYAEAVCNLRTNIEEVEQKLNLLGELLLAR